MEEPETEEMSESNVPTPSQGYCIRICVRPDGFTVSEPEPLADTSDESMSPEPDGELVPDVMTMVKHLLHVIKQNPLGEEASAQMDEGFQTGPGAAKADAD